MHYPNGDVGSQDESDVVPVGDDTIDRTVVSPTRFRRTKVT